MKNTTFPKLLFSFILIGLFGCEQEPVNQIEVESVEPVVQVQTKAPQLNYVSDTAIPDIMGEIKNRTLDGETQRTAGKLNYKNVDIDLDEIMEVVAESNEVNYTFALDVKNGPKHHIYNLVIGKDASGNTKEPYVVGYEMKPKDMKAFFENGEDFSKFNAVYRYYTFDSFFKDSKNNSVGKNGDCGSGSTGGGDPTSNTPPGGTYTHSYQGTGVTNVFNVGTPQTHPYNYTVTITNNDQTTSSATTEAQTPVNTITAGVSQTGATITADLPNYSSTTTTYSTHVSVAPDNALGSGGGGSIICVNTTTVIGDIKIETRICGEANSQKRYTGKTGKSGDCPNTEGAIAINTAGRPARKLFYGLGGTLSPLEIDYFDNNPDKALEIYSFLISQNFSQPAKDVGNNSVDAMMNGQSIVSFSPFVKYPVGSNYESEYPKLTAYLKNELPAISNNQKVIDAINDITDAPKETIKEALEWGKGPEINIIQLGGEGDNEKLGSYRGHIFEDKINILNLDIDLVMSLENSQSVETSDALAFLIAVTILHEYTHLGDTVFSDNFWGDEWVESGFLDENEAGILFEEAVFNEKVFISNAGVVLKRTGGL